MYDGEVVIAFGVGGGGGGGNGIGHYNVCSSVNKHNGAMEPYSIDLICLV